MDRQSNKKDLFTYSIQNPKNILIYLFNLQNYRDICEKVILEKVFFKLRVRPTPRLVSIA